MYPRLLSGVLWLIYEFQLGLLILIAIYSKLGRDSKDET